MAEYSSNLLINPYADEPVTTGWTASNNAEVISGGYLGAAFRLNSPAYLEQVIPVDTFGEDTKGIQLSCRARFINSGPALFAEIVLYLRLQITNTDGTTAFFMPCQAIIMPGTSTWILFEKGFEERISGITEVVFRVYSTNENVIVDLDNISVAIDETRTESEQAFDDAVDYTNMGIEAHLNDITNSHLSDEQKYGLTGGAQRVRSIKLGMEANVRIANRNLYGQLPIVKLEAIREQTPIITPLFWTELLVKTIANVTSTSVAVQYDENGIGKVFVAYVADSTLYIRAAQFSYPISEMIWEDVEEIPGCSQCALDFDGRFTRNGTIIEFLTDDLPWLFYTTTSGELKAGVLGGTYESLVGANVTAVDAVRGVASKYKDIDQGLLLFYIIDGVLYYREYIANTWQNQTPITIAPENVVNVHAERTFDYRIVLQVMDNTGKLYEIFTKMEASGWNGNEYLQTSMTSAIERIAVDYIDSFAPTEVLASQMESDIWHMSIYSATISEVYNLSVVKIHTEEPYDEYNDWGYLVAVELDQIIRNAEANPNQFILIDDDGIQWAGQEAYKTDVRSNIVYVTFTNFNNAVNPITLKCLGGVLSNGYTVMTEQTLQFNAQNLVPTIVPAPLFINAWNDGPKVIYMNFDRKIISVGAQTGFALSAYEPTMSPEGALVNKNYVTASIEIPESVPIQSFDLTEGTHNGTTLENGKIKFDIDPVETVAMTTGMTASNATSSTVTLPAGNVAGDILVVVISKDGTGTFTTPANWTLLAQRAYSAMCLGVFYKVSDGTESTVVIAHASEMTAWTAMILRNASEPIVSTYAEGASLYPNSANLVHTFGLNDMVKWFSVAGWDYNRALALYPSGFTDDQRTISSSSTGGSGVAVSSRSNMEPSSDPGQYQLATSEQWVAYTMAVKSTNVPESPAYYTIDPITLSLLNQYSRLSWTEEVPVGSAVTVEYGFSTDNITPPESWTAMSNLDLFDLTGAPENGYLFIRVTLETSGAYPSVSDLLLFDYNDTARIKITLTDTGRLKYPIGDVAIDFSGSLIGQGNVPVAAFVSSFTPNMESLVFNPQDIEHLVVSMESTIARMLVSYGSAQAENEGLETWMDSTIVRTHIDDLEG